MKWALAVLLLLGAALVILGRPGADPAIGRAALPAGGPPILPMRFVHDDHVQVPCASCHHEFIDRRPGPPCLSCHVTDPKVSPLLEQQFHRLCRDCHVSDHAAGAASGPTRSCIGCHSPDHEF